MKAQTIRTQIFKESAQVDTQYLDEIQHPYDSLRGDLLEYYNSLTSLNSFHARALRVKTDCICNLGYDLIGVDTTTAKEFLNQVNEQGQTFEEVLARVVLDFETTGNGYLEIVRNKAGIVSELYFCPSVLVTRRPRGAKTAFFYNSNYNRIEFNRFTEEYKGKPELLDFANYTQNDVYYGLPDWRGCVLDIELDYYASIYNQKFFLNSGVPDLAVIVEGGKFDEETEKKIVAFFQNNLKGLNNFHRTLILPIDDPSVKIRFEKLAMDNKEGSFDTLRARCRDNIISAHGIPPRIMGVVSSGSLGGGNETQGQLKIFKETVVNPKKTLLEIKLNYVLKAMGFNVVLQFRELDSDLQESNSTYYSTLTSCGILSIDESRAALGYNEPKKEDLNKPKKENIAVDNVVQTQYNNKKMQEGKTIENIGK